MVGKGAAAAALEGLTAGLSAAAGMRKKKRPEQAGVTAYTKPKPAPTPAPTPEEPQ